MLKILIQVGSSSSEKHGRKSLGQGKEYLQLYRMAEGEKMNVVSVK